MTGRTSSNVLFVAKTFPNSCSSSTQSSFLLPFSAVLTFSCLLFVKVNISLILPSFPCLGREREGERGNERERRRRDKLQFRIISLLRSVVET